MLGGAYDWILTQANDAIAALGGKITPSAEARIRQEAEAAIRKAGGAPADVQRAQGEITATLEPYGGSTLPQYGGSALPSAGDIFGSLGLTSWLLIGAGVVLLVVATRD